MLDPLGLIYCPHCKDHTANLYTSGPLLCARCKNKK